MFDEDAERRLNSLTEKIIGCAFLVHNKLGGGFAEKIYRNALAIELGKAGLLAEIEMPIVVEYDGVEVGKYFADIVVERTVLVECKAVRNFDDGHTSQCLNYLAATKLDICLLLNFNKRVDVKRFRHFNTRGVS